MLKGSVMSPDHDSEANKTYFQRSNRTMLDYLEELICNERHFKGDPITWHLVFICLGIPTLVALAMGLLMQSGYTQSKFTVMIILLFCTYYTSLGLLFAGHNTKKEMNQLLDKLLDEQDSKRMFDRAKYMRHVLKPGYYMYYEGTKWDMSVPLQLQPPDEANPFNIWGNNFPLKAEGRIEYFYDLHIKLKTKAEADEVDDEPLLTDEEQGHHD